MPRRIAASATRLPILPRPMTPSVWPRQLEAGELLLAVLDLLLDSSSSSPSQRRARSRSAGTRLRAAISMPASTSSFTALALAPGALNTGTPRSAHRRHRDVVGAGAGAADRLARDGPNLDARACPASAPGSRPGSRRLLRHRVALAPASASGPTCEIVVEDQDLEGCASASSHAAPRTPACSRPALRTPSIGIAL